MKVALILIRDVVSFLALLLLVFLTGAFRGGDSTVGGGVAQKVSGIFGIKKAHADAPPYSESSYYSQSDYSGWGGVEGGVGGECSCESAAQGEGADC